MIKNIAEVSLFNS